MAYQPESQLFCVRARYVPNNPSDYSKGIQVFNQARNGSVTGPIQGVANGTAQIVAFPDDTVAKDTYAAAKLRVAPAFFAPLYPVLKRVVFGPVGGRGGVLLGWMRQCIAPEAH